MTALLPLAQRDLLVFELPTAPWSGQHTRERVRRGEGHSRTPRTLRALLRAPPALPYSGEVSVHPAPSTKAVRVNRAEGEAIVFLCFAV